MAKEGKMDSDKLRELKIRCSLEEVRTLKAKTEPKKSVKGGDMAEVGDTVGVVVNDAGPGEEFVLVYEAAKIVLPKAEDSVLHAGDRIHYSFFNKNVSGSVGSESRQFCGIALEEALEGTKEVLAHLTIAHYLKD
jgi:predicted RecA/RadA family phage recombinase